MNPLSKTTKTARVGLLAVTLVSALSACGNGAADAQDPVTTTPTTTATATPASTPSASHDLVIAPGSVGAVHAGDTIRQALHTGLVAKGAILCPGERIHWRSDRTGKKYFVYTRANTVTQVSVKTPGPHLSNGIEVGSTYRSLLHAYGSDLSQPSHDGWPGTSQVYVEADGDPSHVYLSFQIDGAKPTGASKVTEIAVTDGRRAGFMYDC
ncbi:hypothetical protein [Nocardioides montaniterrae]